MPTKDATANLKACVWSFKVSNKKLSIGDVIAAVDKKFGLVMPIAVFGYHKLKRSISPIKEILM